METVSTIAALKRSPQVRAHPSSSSVPTNALLTAAAISFVLSLPGCSGDQPSKAPAEKDHANSVPAQKDAGGFSQETLDIWAARNKKQNEKLREEFADFHFENQLSFLDAEWISRITGKTVTAPDIARCRTSLQKNKTAILAVVYERTPITIESEELRNFVTEGIVANIEKTMNVPSKK